MDKKSLLNRFKEELRESHQNYLKGKTIPWEDFDWGKALTIKDSHSEYRVDNQA